MSFESAPSDEKLLPATATPDRPANYIEASSMPGYIASEQPTVRAGENVPLDISAEETATKLAQVQDAQRMVQAAADYRVAQTEAQEVAKTQPL